MGRIEASYPIPRFGLATSFTESETPVQYALRFRNRFINSAGGAEKRPGMSQLGSTITGTPNLTAAHELVGSDGTETLFVSGEGSIWKFDGASTYTQVYSGGTSTAIYRSVQFGSRLIFINGVDRNFYTEDGTTFHEHEAVIIKGETAGAVSAGGVDDSDVTDWVTNTDLVANDLIHNLSKNAYGLVLGVTTANATHTAIGTAATGLGQATGNQGAGDRYTAIDLVELNIISAATGDDNVAVAGPGTSARTIAVSGVNFANTDIRVGDFISNTTRSAVAMVSAIATALTVTSVAGQTSADSLVFLKSAMPIASNIHSHFGRVYYVDSRDERLIRISGAGASDDMTTDAATLDSTTFKFGELQPKGDVIKALHSFQRFLGIAGKSNLFLFEGTDPIADTSANARSFGIVGLFPQGTVSRDGMLSIGNDLVFVTKDGVQTAAMVSDASSLGRANISEAIKTTLRNEIEDTSESQIILIHYPRRSWLLIKIGSQMYVFNYTSYLGNDRLNEVKSVNPQTGSWSLFDGKFARQNGYFVRANSDLICVGSGGKVYKFDAGTFSDDGEVYKTEFTSSWLTLTEPKKSTIQKEGMYIKPLLDVGGDITYSITAEGGFMPDSRETITVATSGGSQPIGIATVPFTIGGSSIQDRKYALRWRGEQARITISTEDANGPDVISRFTIYGTTFGVR